MWHIDESVTAFLVVSETPMTNIPQCAPSAQSPASCPVDNLFTVPWHKDDYATMEITLNDNYDGGHVLHLNKTGVYKTEARPGSVTGKHIDMTYYM